MHIYYDGLCSHERCNVWSLTNIWVTYLSGGDEASVADVITAARKVWFHVKHGQKLAFLYIHLVFFSAHDKAGIAEKVIPECLLIEIMVKWPVFASL